jgi:hypothetical protein
MSYQILHTRNSQEEPLKYARRHDGQRRTHQGKVHIMPGKDVLVPIHLVAYALPAIPFQYPEYVFHIPPEFDEQVMVGLHRLTTP